MPNSTLFPLSREPMKTSSKRPEPVLWLRRLVILSALESASIVRNIEYRRGLNIIQTRQMEAEGRLPAGHSVGKTLLIRLIRYTLGEPHFGTEETEASVAAAMETGFIAAHWRVGGVDWIVVRPLNRAGDVESFAVQNNDWQQVVDGYFGEAPFKAFENAVRDAVLADLPTFTLPRGREAKWLDVLAWLSRDYQCGYRRANEWRHEDANSGPSLDREENSQIMQWLLGLMSQDEIDLKLKHRELLDEQAKHKREEDRQQHRLESLRPALWEKLKLDQEAEIEGGQQTIDSVNPVKVVADEISSLQALKAERHAESRIGEFEHERDSAQSKLIDTEATIRSCKNMLTFYAKQIEQHERDPLKVYEKCQAKPTCWIREKARETANDPSADDQLADLRNLYEREGQKLSAAKSSRVSLEEELKQANSRLLAERARVAKELSGIDESIGKWRGYEGDAKTYQEAAASLSAARKSLKRSGREAGASEKTLRGIRSKHQRRIGDYTKVYQQILQRIFGEAAMGQIQVGGKGLQPVPDRKLAPTGAAMSVMTTVLAFDIACVAASAYGVGQHPRFLMHDSPREGEMQPPLFRRLFEIAIDLEQQFDEPNEVSFQYIITTASEIPAEIGRDEFPYVRETLYALADDDLGLLLKKRF